MSSLKITNVSNKNKDSGAVIAGVSTVSGTGQVKLPVGTTGERVGIESGSLRYNSTDNTLEFYNGTSWLTISQANRYLGSRGVFAGGSDGFSTVGTIDSITLATTGNALNFGSLTVARGTSGCSSSTRGVFGGGGNVIDYITIATTGNATDFGDLTRSTGTIAACSSSTRGVFGGGYATPAYQNIIDYITIATTGNAIDFGDLTLARSSVAACSSSTRGVFGGGDAPAPVSTSNIIDYITIATTGNAIDFGDLTVARYSTGACSSSTRGVFAGGNAGSPGSFSNNVIDYITIASTGNATDFGDLTSVPSSLAACSSSTRGVFGGGSVFISPSFFNTNTIDYITIASVGNATDFGDLTVGRQGLGACSDAHGGLS